MRTVHYLLARMEALFRRPSRTAWVLRAADDWPFLRYRCAFCSTDFCDACSTTPYHDGFTCEEFAAPRCSLCRETPLLGQDTTADTVRSLTAQELRAAILVMLMLHSLRPLSSPLPFCTAVRNLRARRRVKGLSATGCWQS